MSDFLNNNFIPNRKADTQNMNGTGIRTGNFLSDDYNMGGDPGQFMSSGKKDSIRPAGINIPVALKLLNGVVKDKSVRTGCHNKKIKYIGLTRTPVRNSQDLPEASQNGFESGAVIHQKSVIANEIENGSSSDQSQFQSIP